MATLRFTANLARHLDASDLVVRGTTVAEVLAEAARQRPQLRSYLLDDQGALRKHVSAFVDGGQVRDRQTLTDPVGPEAMIDIIQALSGG